MPEPDRTSIPAPEGPLVGLRVLDFSRLYPGPLGTRLMALLGAEVIKVENSRHPDPMHLYPPFVDGESAGYLVVNRDKQVQEFDFDDDGDRRRMLELVRSADVLVEQFRPGVMARWGLDFASLQEINPRLIYVSLTGYGQQGPLADRAGHDLNYIALGGVLGLTGTPESGPVVPGVQIADVAGGAYWLVMRTLAALWQRQRTGRGCHVDVAMLEGVLPLIALQYAHFQAGGQRFGPGEHPLAGSLPNYSVYRCRDGGYVALAALERKFWDTFCRVVGHPEWRDGHMAMGEEGRQLRAAVQDLFASRDRAYWEKLAAEHDICLTPVLGLEELADFEGLRPFVLMRRLLGMQY